MPKFSGKCSPLWRAAFYHLSELTNARVGRYESLARRKDDLMELLDKDAGLKLHSADMVQYSKHGLHGYTLQMCLAQSGAMIHSYPEKPYRSATIMIETCESEEVMQPIIDRTIWRLAQFYGARALLRSRTGKPLPLESREVKMGHGMKWLKDYAARWEP